MNTNVHHVQENFYISLQDCINKEEKTKKTCIEYWRREAERAKEESARRRALSIKIITDVISKYTKNKCAQRTV